MEIATMNREAARTLNDAVREALEAVAQEYGLDVNVGGGSFTPTEGSFKPRVEFSIRSVKAEAATKDAGLLGLPDDVIGRTFTHKDHTYTVTGLNLRAPKMPVQATREDGRAFKFPTAMAKRLLDESRDGDE